MINAVFKSSAIALSLATSLVASALSIGAAEAASPEEIKAKGVAVIGVQMDQFPWGFIDENGKNVALTSMWPILLPRNWEWRSSSSA